MGRPRIHQTEEDQKASARARSQKYYESKRDSICASRRKKYEATKGTKGSNVGARKTLGKQCQSSMSDEERKLANRLKSQRYYQRKKSEIQRRRQSGPAKIDARPIARTAGAQPTLDTDQWEEHTTFLAAGYQEVLGNDSIQTYAERVAARFVEDGSREALKASYSRFELLVERVEGHQKDILNELGASAHLAQTEDLLAKLYFTIEMLEDLEQFARVKGWDEFVNLYKSGLLLYQRTFGRKLA